ncbi:MAG: non-canonical purine NTP pyrophosphatase [Chloroflexota bacterium]
MTKTILFATNNFAKKKLYSPVFAEYGFDCLSLPDVGLSDRSPEETEDTVTENALLKAQAIHSSDWPLVFSNDAGLEIDALGGKPGVQTRRWNGHFSNDVDDETWLAYLLEQLNGVPLPERTAHFISAWVFIDPSGEIHSHQVRTSFQIATRQLRPIVPGAPTTAVRIGDTSNIEKHSVVLAKQMRRWGILEKLQQI